VMQYYCKNQERRLKVGKKKVVNGIDYLEVASENQWTLEVHFIHALPGQPQGVPDSAPALTKDNFKIDGGLRIPNVKVAAIESAVGKVMRLTVNTVGDFSTYTLRLVNSPSDDGVPDQWDTQLAAVDFSFKAGCPSDFDCQTEQQCTPIKKTDPRINYLAKDYSSFRRLAFDRLSLLMPDWRERNPADLQVALIELMAYTGDYLSYYQDAVATEAYLFKARKRVSIRRHARLLDYHMHNGCNARTWVAIEVAQGGQADNIELKKGTRLFTKKENKKPTVSEEEMTEVLREKGVEVFETMYDFTLHFAHNEMEFYTWDNASCCLPKGSISATLYRSDMQPILLKVGQVLIFEEVKSPTQGNRAGANSHTRHAVRLVHVDNHVKDRLNDITVTEIRWHEEDALPFPICISAEKNGISIKNISVARGNVVLADHGSSIKGKELLPSTAEENEVYRPFLPHTEVSVTSSIVHAEKQNTPATKMLIQNPHACVADIQLVEGDDIWTARRDLLASGRFTLDFVPEIESDGSVQLRFGDDTLGKKPGVGFKPVANYRIGNGRKGNIGADAIGRIHWNTSGILSVRNPLPARGGKNPETIEEVKQYAPEAFKTQERAVTEADYIAKTEMHPGVQKALAEFRWTGSWHTVFLTIDRKNGIAIDSAFKEEIYLHLDKYRMAGYDLEIISPQFADLEIEMQVCVKTGYFRNAVKQKLQEAFSRFDLPNGERGFFHPDNFTFGQPLYLSVLYQSAMKIDGVASVEVKTFKRLNRMAALEKENGVLIPTKAEIIRLDNDLNFPEKGKINFLMYGGL